MFWFLPLLGKVLLGGAVIGAAGWAINKYVIEYLTEKKLKDRAKNHPPMDIPKILGETIGNKLKNKEFNNQNIGLEDSVKNTEKHSPTSSPLSDEIIGFLKSTWSNSTETERVFTGYQHNGKVLFSPERNKECIYTFEDSETERVFVGTYYDGEVQSIEEIEYEEIESDLKRRLDREEIVIL